MSELADQIVENVKASGATTTINSSKTVYFGKIPAYRYDLTTVKDGVTVTQYDYELITGGYLYEVAFTSQNASMLAVVSREVRNLGDSENESSRFSQQCLYGLRIQIRPGNDQSSAYSMR
jgi:hypothetical protein